MLLITILIHAPLPVNLSKELSANDGSNAELIQGMDGMISTALF